MKTNTPKKENPIQRKTIVIGEEEVPQIKKKNSSTFLILFCALIFFGSQIQKHDNQAEQTKVATISFDKINSPDLFLEKTPLPTVEPTPPVIVKAEVKTYVAPKIEKASATQPPGYHEYDHIISREAKKIQIDPAIIKAIIEQESHYKFDVFAYVPQWERQYSKHVPKKPWENVENWRMNFSSIGLMQIGYVLHKDFCGLNSYADLLNPEINISCGVKLFDRCLSSGKSKTQCIKQHNGSGPAAENYKNQVLGRISKIINTNNKMS